MSRKVKLSMCDWYAALPKGGKTSFLNMLLKVKNLPNTKHNRQQVTKMLLAGEFGCVEIG